MWVTPSAFAIDTAITSPAALNEPVGNLPLILDQDLGGPECRGQPRHRQERRDGLAEADDVAGSPHRQQLAITPQIVRRRASVSCSGPCAPLRIVAHQQRPAREDPCSTSAAALAGRRAPDE